MEQVKKSKGKSCLIIGLIILTIAILIPIIIIVINGGVKKAGDKLKDKADSLQSEVMNK